MIKNPILVLNNGITITSMYADGVSGSVLVSLSDGRILKIDEITMLAYLTGDRILSAQVTDGFGSVSSIGNSSVLYALHNRIIEVNKVKEQIKWKEVTQPFSATEGEVLGVFTSPVMWGGQDFGFWKGLYWKHYSPENTKIAMYARVASDSESILSAEWKDMSPWSIESENIERESSSSSFDSQNEVTYFKSLDKFNTKGSYLQLKLVLGTSESLVSPIVSKITASYETKFAVYFFTQKFIMKQDSNAKNLLLTGKYSMPQNTEVKFGISPTGSSDWNDYTIIESDKINSMPANTDRFKVGIKLSTWDDSVYPSVDEFAIMLGAEKDNLLNGG